MKVGWSFVLSLRGNSVAGMPRVLSFHWRHHPEQLCMRLSRMPMRSFCPPVRSLSTFSLCDQVNRKARPKMRFNSRLTFRAVRRSFFTGSSG